MAQQPTITVHVLCPPLVDAVRGVVAGMDQASKVPILYQSTEDFMRAIEHWREVLAVALKASRQHDQAALRAMSQGLHDYVVWNGPLHDDACPGDDTCACSLKPLNDGANEACRFLRSLAEDR
jgi:hypothetical protein